MRRYKYLLLVAVVLLSACGKSDQEKALQRQKQVRADHEAYEAAFKVGVMPTMDCLPIYLLKDSLLYDTTKVDVRLLYYTAQMDCDTAMLRRRVQASTTDLFRAERLKRRYRVPLVYLTETNATWQLIANRKSKIKKLADLSDKIVAMTRNSITDYLTSKVIKEGKPKYQVYKAQINDVFVRLKMLQNDEIDAIWATEPQATQALVWENNVLYNSAEDAFAPGVIVFVGESDINKQEEFQKAYNKAVDLINKNGAKYYSALMCKYMKVDERVVKSLPKLTYKRIISPRPADIMKAQCK